MTKNKNEKTPAVNTNEDKSNKQHSNSSEKSNPSKRLKTFQTTNEMMDAYAMPKTGKEIVFDTSVSNNDMIHNKDTPSLTNTQKETIVENLKMLSGEVNQTIFLNNEEKKHKNLLPKVNIYFHLSFCSNTF